MILSYYYRNKIFVSLYDSLSRYYSSCSCLNCIISVVEHYHLHVHNRPLLNAHILDTNTQIPSYAFICKGRFTRMQTFNIIWHINIS